MLWIADCWRGCLGNEVQIIHLVPWLNHHLRDSQAWEGKQVTGNHIFILRPMGEKGKDLSQPTHSIYRHVRDTGHSWGTWCPRTELGETWAADCSSLHKGWSTSSYVLLPSRCSTDPLQTYSSRSAGLAKSTGWGANQICVPKLN